MANGADILRIEDLFVTFSFMDEHLEAVRGASLRIMPGKVTALVGESGSGKSVISQAVMGILPRIAKARGSIFFNDGIGEPVDILSLAKDGPQIRALRGGRIGMIFQEPMTSLSPLHTIGNQVGEALGIHEGLSRAERRERTEDMLAMVGFAKPAKAHDMYPFELSGGMRQRAMIAMALICRPALLIADEPTTALDVTIQAQILTLLRDLQERLGMAMLLITHDLGVVANVADEVSVIYHGEILEAGPVDAIFRNARHPYLRGLMAAVPHFEMKVGERLKALREIPVEVSSLIRAKPKPTIVAPPPKVLLSVRDLTKSYASRHAGYFSRTASEPARAVDGISFDIRRGECLGLVGESGCGKTTVGKMLVRAVPPDGGSLIYRDEDGNVDLLNTDPRSSQELKAKIQMVFQDPVSSLSPRMTVQDILTEPLEIHQRGGTAERRETAAALMAAIGLKRDHLRRYPHSFSGGQRQRIGIARAMALGPKLMVCDEPVSALDVSVQAQILNLLKDLQKEMDLTYLFISHNLAVVAYMADRIAVMCRGRIVELASRETLMHAPVHPYTRALLNAVPFPDLDRRLDFANLRSDASRMATWSAPFRDDVEGDHLSMIEIGEEHFVLARSTADISELAQ